MPDEDRGRARVVGGALERGVARVAGAGLDVGTRVDVDRDHARLGADLGGRVAHHPRVVVGSVAQSVIDVHRHDVEITCPSQREQRERVGAAGATHDDARAGPEVVDAAHPRGPRRHRMPVGGHRGADRRSSPLPTIRSSSPVSRTPRRCTIRRSPAYTLPRLVPSRAAAAVTPPSASTR